MRRVGKPLDDADRLLGRHMVAPLAHVGVDAGLTFAGDAAKENGERQYRCRPGHIIVVIKNDRVSERAVCIYIILCIDRL